MSSIVKPESREGRNALFTILGNHRRRYVLYACNRADGEITLSEVAEQVAAWEYEKPVAEITSTERKRIYTSIQQHHLSKLEEAGLLTVENDHITTTEKARQLDVYLEVVPEKNIPWAIYYLGLSAVGGAALTLSHFGLVPEGVTVPVVSGLFVAFLGMSALIHVFQSQQMKFETVDVPPEVDE